jgi:queuine tRNA-ribosyltransferase
MFGIVQGGTDRALRERSVRDVTALPFEGFAVGGLSVGESPDAMRDTLSFTAEMLPAGRPRYLMGVGGPLDLVDAVGRGVDLFDCVIASRNGRRGHLFTRDGVVRIGRREHERDESPLDEACRCEACRRHSRAYLRHLFAVGEHASVVLGTLHNVTFLVDWVRSLREAVLAGRFADAARAMTLRYEAGEARSAAVLARDPEGREGSRRAADERRVRRSEALRDETSEE